MPLKVSDGMSTWIDDFKKSDAPQFKGKNADERRDMAIAAYLSAKKGPLQKEHSMHRPASVFKSRMVKEELVNEATDPKMRKVKQLANLGLVNKADVQKLMTAMKSIADNKPVPPKQRKIIFDAFGDLIDMITGDTQLFQKVRKGVNEAIDPSDTGGAEEASMAMRQVKAMRHYLDGIEARVQSTGDMEEWYQNKLTKANDYLKTLYGYGKGDN